ERSARIGSFSIREEVAMAVQRNRDDRSQIRRSAPSAATGVTLSLAKYGCMMPSTTRLTAASPPALGCKCGPAEEGACCAATFAAAKTATVTIKPKRVA